MDWSSISTKTLIVVGVIAICVAIAGTVTGWYLFHYHSENYYAMQLATLCMTLTLFAVLWTKDAIRCAVAESTARDGDLVRAEEHLSRVRMLPKKADAIREDHCLVRIPIDKSRPLGLCPMR